MLLSTVDLSTDFTWHYPETGWRWAASAKHSAGEPFQAVGVSPARAAWLTPDEANALELKRLADERMPYGDGGIEAILRRPHPIWPYLITARPKPAKRTYTPFLDQPGLFRRFAELPADAEHILAFANQFGLLFGGDRLVVPPWHTEPIPLTGEEDVGELLDAGTVVTAEAFDTWAAAINSMRTAVQLWDAIQLKNEEVIQNLIGWTGDQHVEYDGHKWPLASTAQLPLDVANALLRSHIDRTLNRRIGGRRAPLVAVRYAKEGLHITPPSLLAAMWLQFASADHEGKQFARCPGRNCPRVWFEKSTGPGVGKREDAEFCSPECRHTAYRDRKSRARALHKDGRPAREIARELGTDIAQVKLWIGSARRS
jgi:hypothetical protein